MSVSSHISDQLQRYADNMCVSDYSFFFPPFQYCFLPNQVENLGIVQEMSCNKNKQKILSLDRVIFIYIETVCSEIFTIL